MPPQRLSALSAAAARSCWRKSMRNINIRIPGQTATRSRGGSTPASGQSVARDASHKGAIPFLLLLLAMAVVSQQGNCKSPRLSVEAFVPHNHVRGFPTGNRRFGLALQRTHLGSGAAGTDRATDAGARAAGHAVVSSTRSTRRIQSRTKVALLLCQTDGVEESPEGSQHLRHQQQLQRQCQRQRQRDSSQAGSRRGGGPLTRSEHTEGRNRCCRAPCRGVAGPAPWARSSRELSFSPPKTLVPAASAATTLGAGTRASRACMDEGSRRGGRTYRRARELHRLRAVVGRGDGGSGDGGDQREGYTADETTRGNDDTEAAVAAEGNGGTGGQTEQGKDEGGWLKKRWRYALAKIKREPLQTLTIPVSAACVGWITNKLAVEMIFHPLVWRGIPLRVIEGEPLGLIGWQGIVPAKAGVMAERMVDMVTTQLVDVEEVFRRLSPGKIARLLGPEVDSMVQSVYDDLAPQTLGWLPGGYASGLPLQAVDELKGLRRGMLVGMTKDMQKHITKILDLKEMVVGEMLRDRSLMVSLFQRCGKAEFKFLVNSGFFFGFLLGVIQMFVWLIYDKPWTLPAGGAVVGYITNWLAIKFIFEPVNPVKIGPWVLQGLFLKRQDEVAADFAEFFSNNVLTSNKLWKAMIDGSKAEAFRDLVAARVVPFVSRASAVAGANLDPLTVKSLAVRAAAKLGDHVHVLHEYTDNTLALRETMTVQMQKMSTRTFEGVLHPVFQEEEFTLIVAGAILGAIAGFLQMLLSTKGVRQAARKAAARAAAAADGVVGAGGELVGGVVGGVGGGSGSAAQVAQAAQKRAVGWREKIRRAGIRFTTSTRQLAQRLYRSATAAGRAAAAAIADRYHRRRRRNRSEEDDDDDSDNGHNRPAPPDSGRQPVDD